MTWGPDTLTLLPMMHLSERLVLQPPAPVAIALAGGPSRILGAIVALVAAFDEALERGRQRRALARLEDHHLRDIGITRAQAKQEARKPFWRR
ncbi:MAG: DUF1127 domain-containing protein [Hyphomicrobiales bacterium]|nr:DUF1127 domain-containing protein [Hyphomicrobiales bacterium]